MKPAKLPEIALSKSKRDGPEVTTAALPDNPALRSPPMFPALRTPPMFPVPRSPPMFPVPRSPPIFPANAVEETIIVNAKAMIVGLRKFMLVLLIQVWRICPLCPPTIEMAVTLRPELYQ